jgi:hypothetical protein
VANLLTADGAPEAERRVAIGARVQVTFQPVAAEFVLPQFHLTDEPAAGPVWRFPG